MDASLGLKLARMNMEISRSLIQVYGGSSFVRQKDGLLCSTTTSFGRILLSILQILLKKGLTSSIHAFVSSACRARFLPFYQVTSQLGQRMYRNGTWGMFTLSNAPLYNSSHSRRLHAEIERPNIK